MRVSVRGHSPQTRSPRPTSFHQRNLMVRNQSESRTSPPAAHRYLSADFSESAQAELPENRVQVSDKPFPTFLWMHDSVM